MATHLGIHVSRGNEIIKWLCDSANHLKLFAAQHNPTHNFTRSDAVRQSVVRDLHTVEKRVANYVL